MAELAPGSGSLHLPASRLPGEASGYLPRLDSVEELFAFAMKKNSPLRPSSIRNDYRCSIEKNQTGKYCVRIRVLYPRHAWTLAVYFLASSFDRAMKNSRSLSTSSSATKKNSGSGAWTAPKTWAFPRSSSRKPACTWTSAPNSPARLPTSPSSLNAMSLLLSLGPFPRTRRIRRIRPRPARRRLTPPLRPASSGAPPIPTSGRGSVSD